MRERERKRLQNGALGLERFLGGRLITKETISEKKAPLNTCSFLRKFQHCKLTFRWTFIFIIRPVRVMFTNVFNRRESKTSLIQYISSYFQQQYICVTGRQVTNDYFIIMSGQMNNDDRSYVLKQLFND